MLGRPLMPAHREVILLSGEMRYFQTTQFVPTKGESYTYYECDEDLQVQRFLTHIPDSGEIDRVEVDWPMDFREEGAEEIDREEFLEHWENAGNGED